MSANNEEQRKNELRKCQNYQRDSGSSPTMRKPSMKGSESIHVVPVKQTKQFGGFCYTCYRPGHLTCTCHQRKKESSSRLPAGKKLVMAKQVRTGHKPTGAHDLPKRNPSPLSFLFSQSDSDDSACQVCVKDQGSKP